MGFLSNGQMTILLFLAVVSVYTGLKKNVFFFQEIITFVSTVAMSTSVAIAYKFKGNFTTNN